MDRSLTASRDRERNGGDSGKVRRSGGDRSKRVSSLTSPYQGRNEPEGSRIEIKFLIKTSIAGALIGAGGKTIREVIETSGANVRISNNQDTYEGDRIAFISGDARSVNKAQSMIWQLLAVLASEGEDVNWSPKVLRKGAIDLVNVEGRILIPSSVAGAVIGTGGATMKSIINDTGANIQMSKKGEPGVDRLISLSGTKAACAKGVFLIIKQIAESVSQQEEAFTARGGGGQGYGRSGGGGGGGGAMRSMQSFSPESFETAITMAVPDALVGTIIGMQGNTLREIQSLSGSTITVSSKSEMVPGTSNRIVTISGTPTSTQMAHMIITQKLQQV